MKKTDSKESTKIEKAQTATQPSQPRPRRRARKRDGPPQFQFLTATDPSQFKNESTKRSVRSQAMIQYRYKSSEEKRKNKEAQQSRPAPILPPVTVELVKPVVTTEMHWQGAREPYNPWMEDAPMYRTTSEAWHRANLGHEKPPQPLMQYTTTAIPFHPAKYYKARQAIPLDIAAQRVLDYEDTDEHETEMFRIAVHEVAPFRTYGDGIDPFDVMPKFSSRELDSFKLVRKCNRTFSSSSTLQKWLPAMLSHPHILLSSTIVASTWMDMHSGVSGESRRTVVIKGEILSWIKERLANNTTLNDDSTLIVIIHMLAGEMWSCNEATMRTHEKGVAKLISHRGGMNCLGGYGTVAQTLASVCYHSNIICEATPLPIFTQWEPPPLPKDDCAALPESPLFCLTEELSSVVRDAYCKEYTYELLSDMRELTDLFIAHHAGAGAILDVETDAEMVHHSSSTLDYVTKIATIRTKLASLPSARVQGLPTSNDFVYESCRIAAIIYTSAILTRVPLSVAADPMRNVVLLDSASASHPDIFNKRLTETLYEVIEFTNIGDIWRNMSGVFYWVTAVGAAAARTPVTTNTYQNPGTHGEAYTTWIRRCLMMFATRAMIILVFQHPIPINLAQKKLLKVQELIGSRSVVS
ncbi:hypothetical protein P280DRAFT_322313 [Massarina eburnea CBS 473.64]|uniref:Tachykinin family protein n=1 Tax=Massarina eburnea CBS 473.64 TaxID=1395130 RepID=A0A6A6RZE2_9PLEO|nr:hypothetical protein P280DRAFT_322313 [Massarina eburnea CBS 473.64]